MNKEVKKRMTKMIINLTAIVASIFVFSYAWFTYETEMDLNEVSVGTAKTNNVFVSETGEEGDWTDAVSIDVGEDFIFNDEVSSNGIEFHKVVAKYDNGSPKSFTDAVVGKDYVTFDIWFKNDSTIGLFLDRKSSVNPASEIFLLDPHDMNHSIDDIERISSYGSYSKDLIAASVRVAFYNYEYNTTLGEYVAETTPIYIWAPNKNIEITPSNGTYEVNMNSENLQNYKYISVTSPTVFHEENVGIIKDEIRASYEEQNAYGEPMIAYINTEDGIEVKAGIKVVVWVEGNDRDAVNAVRGGIFNFDLSFVGIKKIYNQLIPGIRADGNGIEGLAPGMQYSLDGTSTWIDYTDQTLTFDAGDTIYVRFAETTTMYASDYAVLSY